MRVTETGTRARQPDETGFAASADGLRLGWERYGGGEPALFFVPPTPISHSRLWKAQIHYLARHFTLVLYDGRGCGRADNPDPRALWLDRWRPDDCLAGMDATGVERAVIVGICGDGVWPSAEIAAEHPDRVLGIVAIAPGVPGLTPPLPFRAASLETFDQRFEDPQGWQKFNRHVILEDHRGFLEFFFGEMFPEPHSTKQHEDAIAYGLDGPPELLVADEETNSLEHLEEVLSSVRCPVLTIQGDRDNCQPF